MKKLLFLFSLVLIITSCEKTQQTDSEVPYWLQKKIAQDEEIIKSNPQSGLDIAAWIRYDYNGEHYYEYLNLLSSAGPKTYKNDGTEFVYNVANYSDYQSERCCKYYVWKGKSYIDSFD